MDIMDTKFQTYVEERDLKILNAGDYINIYYEYDNRMHNHTAKIVEITEVRQVYRSDCFSIVGRAKYLNRMGKEIANCEIKYHAREIC